MPDDISERLGKLLAGIHDEAERLLVTHAVYEVSSYGWLDEDTPNPEYVGHAMWQVSPPFEHDWEPLLNGGKIEYEPTNRDEILLRNGEDFVGIMELARRSLGMALCYAAVANSENLFFENREFWHEYATTLQWLNIASDRIRDYFVVARFEHAKKKKKYTKNKERGRKYAAPFKETLEGALDSTRELLNKLSRIAIELEDHRTVRDNIVHKVATKTAQGSLEILRKQREFARSGETVQFPAPNLKELLKGSVADSSDETVTSGVQNMKLRYLLLIKASSLVFEFEYFARKRTG